MKKFMLLTLVVLFVFGLAACNEETSTTTTTETQTTESTTEEVTTVASDITFTGVEDVTINWGVEFDPLDGVAATDATDGDITSSITIEGEVDTFRAQTYTLVYTASNSASDERSVERSVTVDYPSNEDFVNVTEREEIVEPYTDGYNLDLSIDGDNANGLPGWGHWGSGGSYVAEDGVLAIDVTQSYYQVNHNNNVFNVGQRYIVTFDVKADETHVNPAAEFTFRSIIGSEEDGWDDHHIQYFNDDVTTEWQTFGFLFTAQYNTENVILFASENKANTLYIRNIEVFELFPQPRAELSGLDDVSVAWDTTFDPLEGVSATDENDGDITDDIVVDGNVDTYYPGTYTIRYSVTNSLDVETITSRTITVEQPTAAELDALLAENTTVPYTANNLDLSENGDSDGDGVPGWGSWGLGGPFSITDGVLTFDVQEEYFQVSNNNHILKTDKGYIVSFDIKAAAEHTGAFRFIIGSEEDGWDDYHIQYFEENVDTEWQTFRFMFNPEYATANVFLMAADGLANTFEVRNLEVYQLDAEGEPTITGHTALDVAWNAEVNLLQDITATDEKDGDLTADIVVEGDLDTFTPGDYVITYSVTDSDGITESVERTITVLEPTTTQLIDFQATDDAVPYTKNNIDLSEDGTAGWGKFTFDTDPESVSFDIVGGVLQITTGSVYSQISNGNNDFVIGQRYIMSFQVRATTLHEDPAVFRTIIGSEEDGWDDYHIQYFDQDVTTEWQTFAFMFEAEYASKNVVLFAFENLANSFEIKDILLTELYPLPSAEITGLTEETVAWDSNFDARLGVAATDETDGDLTQDIIVESDLDTYYPGTYVLRYLVTNSLGVETIETRTVHVAQPTQAEIDALIALETTAPYTENNISLATDGTEDWGIFTFDSNPDNVSITIVNGVLTFTTGSIYSQTMNGGHTLKIDKGYVVTFDVRATAEHTGAFRFIIGSEEDGWDDYHIQTFDQNVNTTYQTFSFMFQAEYATSNVFVIATDLQANTFEITNLMVYELNAGLEPTITGHSPADVAWNGTIDLLDGMSAVDDQDGDITTDLVVEENIDYLVPGDYTVTYSVTNSEGRTATVNRTITVLEPTEADLLAAEASSDAEVYTGGNNLDLSTDGTEGWGKFTFDANPDTISFSITSGVLTINTGNIYSQVTNGGNTFTVGQHYVVTFQVKADVLQEDPAFFRTIIGSEETGWDDFHIQDYDKDVTTAYQTFAFTFQAEYNRKNVVLFAFEGLANTFYIKGIQISELYPEDNPTISWTNPLSVAWGSDLDLLADVTATDTTDGDLTADVTVEGDVDTMVPGTYVVYYHVENSDGVETLVSRDVIVEEATMADLIALSQDDSKTTPYTLTNNLDLTQDGSSDAGGVPGWGSFGTGGPYSVSSGVLTIVNTGNYYDVSNKPHDFVLGDKYIVTFEIKADVLHEGAFKNIVGSEEAGWDAYFEQTYSTDITTEWQTFAFIFEAKYATQNVLIFNSDLFANTFYITNIQIVHID